MATITIPVRNEQFRVDVTLVTEDCCNCGVVFAMTTEFKAQRLRDQAWFYCPAGHAQRYTGKTEAQKLKDDLERVKADRDSWIAQAAQYAAAADEVRKAHAATKGKLTKLKNRVAAGVCTECH